MYSLTPMWKSVQHLGGRGVWILRRRIGRAQPPSRAGGAPPAAGRGRRREWERDGTCRLSSVESLSSALCQCRVPLCSRFRQVCSRACTRQVSADHGPVPVINSDRYPGRTSGVRRQDPPCTPERYRLAKSLFENS
ncbi:hypothetical protein EVAR_44199_1 [Eumeta japonica]|uniref:Uncharacterized protein n=1 Tax=Eumeta variegata TaxID=151549 RepID=A0A4C1W0S2_EUMVA|nr:hypothetical protein EVAR_44199_1 [Eumeta japonica]